MASCHREPRPETYIPADSVAIAGADLNRIRAWLPDSLREASSVIVAYNGKDLRFILRGNFTQAPLGGTLIDSHLALAGTVSNDPPTGPPPLYDRAPHGDLWAVVRGVPLPLSGNAANLNRLLRLVDVATARIAAGPKFDIELTAYCRSSDAAKQFEETVRAAITLAGFDSPVDVTRDGLKVRVAGSASPDLIGKLLR